MSATVEFDITVRINARDRKAAEIVAEYLRDDINGRDFGEATVTAYISASGVVDERP